MVTLPCGSSLSLCAGGAHDDFLRSVLAPLFLMLFLGCTHPAATAGGALWRDHTAMIVSLFPSVFPPPFSQFSACFLFPSDLLSRAPSRAHAMSAMPPPRLGSRGRCGRPFCHMICLRWRSPCSPGAVPGVCCSAASMVWIAWSSIDACPLLLVPDASGEGAVYIWPMLLSAPSCLIMTSGTTPSWPRRCSVALVMRMSWSPMRARSICRRPRIRDERVR